MTNPLVPPENSVRAIIGCPGGGRMILSAFPGLRRDPRHFDPAFCDATLARIAALGSQTLLVLPEPGELPPDAFPGLAHLATRHHLTLTHLPIADYGVPDAVTLARWRTLSPDFRRHLADQGTVALCCQAGAGRSGLLAAMVLVDLGCTPASAMAEVRRHHPPAIETADQENWLLAYGAGTAAGG